MMSSRTRKPAKKPTTKTATRPNIKSVAKNAVKNASTPPKAASRRAVKAAPGTNTHSQPQADLHTDSRPASDGFEPLEMRIPADARWVRVVRLAAAGVASVLNFSIDEIEDIKLAVAEACNNAILHAAPPSGSPKTTKRPQVTITFIPAADHLEIRVRDEGRLLTHALPQRKKTAPGVVDEQGRLPEGGLGLLVIETVMDEVRHESGSDTDTTLRMVKYVRTAA